MGEITKKITSQANIVFVSILLIGLFFRLITANQSLWLDEAIGAIAAQDYSYIGIVTEFIKSDNHPPLYYLTLKFWMGIFGSSDIAIRSLSIVFGLFTIYLTYKIAEFFDEEKQMRLCGFNFPQISALLISVSQFAVYFSQEARMYQMAGFLVALSFYFLILALKSNKVLNWMLFSVSTTLLIFTDYLPVFFLPVPPIILLMQRERYRNLFKPYFLSLIPALIIGLLWIPMFISQVKGYQTLLSDFSAWKTVAGGISPKEISLLWIKFIGGRISFMPKALYYGFVIAVSIPVIIVIFKGAVKKHLIPLYLWIVVPVLLCILASIFFPAFNYFRFVFILPPVFILIAYGSFYLSNHKLGYICLLFTLTAFLVQNGVYALDPNQQRERWREAVSFVESSRDYEKLALFSFPEPFAPYRWYSNGEIRSVGGIDKLGFTLAGTKKKVEAAIAGKHTVYYFEYLYELTDPNKVIEQILIHDGYSVGSRKDFPGVGIVTTYEKK